PAFSFNSSHKGKPCSQLNDFGHPLKDSPHPLTRLTSPWTPGTLSKGAGRQAGAAAAAAASHTKGNNRPASLREKEKLTAPGIPRRSPIQVLTRPDTA